MTGFRAFAEQIGVAVYNADGSLFEDRAMISEQTCSGGEELGPCVDQPDGTVLEGVWEGLWRTDLAELVPPGEIASDFEAFVADAAEDRRGGFPGHNFPERRWKIGLCGVQAEFAGGGRLERKRRSGHQDRQPSRAELVS